MVNGAEESIHFTQATWNHRWLGGGPDPFLPHSWLRPHGQVQKGQELHGWALARGSRGRVASGGNRKSSALLSAWGG